MASRLAEMTLRLRVNLRLSSVKLAACLIGLSPFKPLTVKILAAPLGVWLLLRMGSRWAGLARFGGPAGLRHPLLAIPRYFFREAEDTVWLAELNENDGAISRHVAFDGLEALRSAVDGGKGAIVLGAHYGPAIFSRLLKEKGIEVKPVVSDKTMKCFQTDSGYCLPFLKTRRLKFLLEGPGIFVSRMSERDIVRHVKKDGIVFMMIDIPAHYVGGEKTGFLGSDFRFNTFAFKLALRHELPVFFSFLKRRDDGGFLLSMKRCEGFASPGEGLKMYVRELESMITADPFAWAGAQKFCRWVNHMR